MVKVHFHKVTTNTVTSFRSFLCWNKHTWWIFSTHPQKTGGLCKECLCPREINQKRLTVMTLCCIIQPHPTPSLSLCSCRMTIFPLLMKLFLWGQYMTQGDDSLVLGFVSTWGHLVSVGRFFSWKRLSNWFFWSRAIILLTASLSFSSCSNVWTHKKDNSTIIHFISNSSTCGLFAV